MTTSDHGYVQTANPCVYRSPRGAPINRPELQSTTRALQQHQRPSREHSITFFVTKRVANLYIRPSEIQRTAFELAQAGDYIGNSKPGYMRCPTENLQFILFYFFYFVLVSRPSAHRTVDDSYKKIKKRTSNASHSLQS